MIDAPHMLTAQQIFDKVAEHLLKQNDRCMSAKSVCSYSGDNGLKCAVGVLIPDELYDRSMEGQSYSSIYGGSLSAALTKGGVDLKLCIPLLNGLQRLHDHEKVSAWRAALVALAHVFNLNPKVANDYQTQT